MRLIWRKRYEGASPDIGFGNISVYGLYFKYDVQMRKITTREQSNRSIHSRAISEQLNRDTIVLQAKKFEQFELKTKIDELQHKIEILMHEMSYLEAEYTKVSRETELIEVRRKNLENLKASLTEHDI
jgi:chromosome segregation ATPase